MLLVLTKFTIPITLDTICNTRVGMMCSRLPSQKAIVFELDKKTTKKAVNDKEISRYYFVGNFDVSPFITMPIISLLLKVLATIQGHGLACRAAIFKLLQIIAKLRNVSSGSTGVV